MGVRIALLGQPRVLSDDGAIEHALPRKTLNVLGYLILNRRRAPTRDTIAFALFPDEDEERARTSLRRNLSYLLSALPDGKSLIGADSERIAWNPGTGVHVDVIAFEEAAVQGRDGDALAEYGGELLPTIYDEWTVADRERLRDEFHDVLARTVAHRRSERNFDGASAAAHRLLGEDPWREDIVRLLMAVRYEAGDRAGALAVFERFAQRLRDEMGAEPMPETIAVRDALLRGARLATSDAPLKGADAPAEPALPFVGRDEAMAVARSAWRGAADRSAGILFVAGEAGVGKTRFATELARLTEREGGLVVRGHTSAGGEHRPYEAFVDALRNAPGLLDDHAGAALTDDRAARLRLFESVRRRLSELSHARPIVVVLEDLHWAGPSTIDLLDYLTGRLERAPVLFVATMRSEEMAGAPALRALRRQLRGRSFVHEVVLRRLSATEATKAARSALPDSVDDAALASAIAWVDGIPLLLVEAVRDLAAGRQSHASDVTALVGERLERLTPNAETAVFFGATIGERFDLGTLVAATGWRDDEALDALRELIDGGLVRATARAPALTFAFTHDLIRVASTQRIAVADRARAHGMIARALLAQSPNDDAAAAAVARHFASAGEPRRAAEQYARSARYALGVYANEDARASASEGLALCPQDDAHAALRYRLFDLREQSLARIGELEVRRADANAMTALAADDETRALALGRLVEAHITDPGGRRDALERMAAVAGVSQRAAAQYEFERSRVAHFDARFRDARDAALEAASIFEGIGDERAAIRAQCFAVALLYRIGGSAEALSEVERLRPVLEESGDPALQAEFLLLASATAADSNTESALVDARRSLDLALRIGDRWNEAKARQNLGVVASKLRLYDESLDQHERALAAFRDVGDALQIRDSSLNIAGVRIFCGDFNATVRELIDTGQENATPWLELRRYLLRGTIAVHSGSTDEARRFLAEGKRLAQSLEASYFVVMSDVLNAMNLMSAGETAAALQAIASAVDVCPALGELDVTAEAYALGARLFAVMGDVPQARDCAGRAAALLEKLRPDSYSLGSWHLAVAYDALGERDAACTFARAAAHAAVDDALRMPAGLAESYLRLPWHRQTFEYLWNLGTTDGMEHKGTGKREEIETGRGDEKRYIRRDEDGHFTDDQVDVGRSLTADRRQHAKHEAPKGEGDRGDRSR